MKMTKSKKIAMIGFLSFLGFMAICTVIAKGIYRAGLPQVTTQKPYSSSLTHMVTVTGTVKQGQEYGFFVEAGLRIVTISVHAGDYVTPGDALFQIDTKDLQRIINEKTIELEKQKREQGTGASASVNIMKINCQKDELSQLQAIMEADGWIVAENAGQILECKITVGERTGDAAGILYAMDDGERMIQAVFTNNTGDHISENSEFELIAGRKNGPQMREKITIDHLTQISETEKLAQFFVEDMELMIGQSVTLNCRTQTESFRTCVPVNSLHTDQIGGRTYVYVLEEHEGILGAEWKARKIYVIIKDQTDVVAAIESAEITANTRIITSYTGTLADGDIVRLIN